MATNIRGNDSGWILFRQGNAQKVRAIENDFAVETTIKSRPVISSEPAQQNAPEIRRTGPSARVHAFLLSYPRAFPAFIFLAIVAATLIGVASTEIEEDRLAQTEASVDADAVAGAIERRGERFASLLEMNRTLFSAIGSVSDERFGILIAEVARDMEVRGASSFGWIEVVDSTDAQGEPIASLAFLAPNRPSNEAIVGTDLNTDPIYADALREAARTNVATLSGIRRTGSGDEGQASSFAMILPVYAERTGGGVEQGDLTGYFYTGFDTRRFLADSIAPLDQSSLPIALYDGEIAPENLLAGNASQSESARQEERTITLGGRSMTLVVETPFQSSLTQVSMALLLFGLTLACLLMLAAQWLADRAGDDQRRLAFLEEQHSIRNSLSRELNHRVRNTLASVLSIHALTRRRSKTMDEFADSLERRIRSLSNTHDLLADVEWGTTPIRDVLSTELAHYVEEGQTVVLEGPGLELAPAEALSFGLAIHELTTNAAKFGALSVPEGRVEVKWYLDENVASDTKIAVVEWIEKGGPRVAEERTRGFGSDLIERLVPSQLNHQVELDFRAEGVRCKFGVPVRKVSDFTLRKTPLRS